MKQANLDTERLGGVDVPSADRLREMHESPYILHARGGELEEQGDGRLVLLSGSGAQYVYRSGDEGRTWDDVRDAADFDAIRWKLQ